MIRKHFWWILCAVLLFSVTIISWTPEDNYRLVNSKTTDSSKLVSPVKEVFEQYITSLYQAANLQQAGLDLSVFQKAVTGYLNLKLANKLPENSSVITVVDLSKPSHEKRMWIIDVLTKHLIINTWVAHGSGSGDDVATQFSDINDSHQSSLGFYLTDNVYMGKHGKSLRLDGLDEGFNSTARARDIVLHAAKYVGQRTIDEMGRLGHSFGCPAVAPEVRDRIINTIKGRTVLFINGNDSNYNSKYLDETALTNFVPDTTTSSVLTATNSR